MNSSSRIAINTVIQYVQLFTNLLISLVTVRVLLKALGVEDYGVYNLIGGVVSLLSFISSSLSQTSIRFISVSLGKGNDKNKTKDVVSACFSLHLYIAFLLAIIIEIVGFFLFDGFFNIPPDRIHAAQIVYHCTVLTLIVSIVSTPFQAILTSHERFVFLSLVAIGISILKLLIAYTVSVVQIDKLILYGILMTLVSITDFICYVLFCVVKHRDCIGLRLLGFSSIRPIMGFASWTLLDVLSTVINRQGYAITLNKFFGPTVNSAYAIGGQTSAALFPLSSSIINTMKPQILKSYGAGDTRRSLRLSISAGKFGFTLLSMVSIPLLVFMPEVLSIWLGDVPNGAVFIARVKVLANMVEQLTRGLVYVNQAEGNIKWFSIIVSCTRMLALPISIVCMLGGATMETAMLVFLGCEALASFVRVLVMTHKTELKISDYLKSILFQVLPSFLMCLLLCIIASRYAKGILGLFTISGLSAAVYLALMYSIGLNRIERFSINNMIRVFYYKFIGHKAVNNL